MNDTPVQAQPSPVARRKRSPVRKLIGILVIVILLLLALPVSNLFRSPAKSTVLAQVMDAQPQWKHAVSILERSCMDCHSSVGDSPLYEKLPVAGSLIQRDRNDGVRALDLLDVFSMSPGEPPAETALAKLEYVLKQGSMPPGRYLAMHWNRGVGGAEKDALMGWIRDVRKQFFAGEGVAAEFANGPLQPLPLKMQVDDRKVVLGNKLFHDKRLSGDNTVSCASCHALNKGGTDQSKTSTGIAGAIGPINAPTVYNAVFNVKQFWDGRAEDLHAQAGGPVENPKEMGAKFDQVIAKLQQDEAFVAEFKTAYPEGLNKTNITHAIAEFEKTLITPNSRFDQYLRGKAEVLTADEQQGYHLFVDRGCANCHVGKAMGGQSFELMGREADYFADRGNPTEADNGLFNFTKREEDRHFFKVPTLRNIAVTFPYFHDGSQQTLDGAVAAMAKYQIDRPLSTDEAKNVVLFLKTLTGEYGGAVLQ